MDALLLAVFNALWQGAALIALVALALRAGLRRNATTACVVWSVTFLVVALLPALDLALARPAVTPPASFVARAGNVAMSAALKPQSAAASAVRTTTSATRAAAAELAPAPQRAQDLIGPIRASIGERVREGSMRVGSAATAFARGWGIALLCAWALVA
ncbi:MAG: hypothetical protein JWM87_10, partial [Candidatus Eremiobacteraeota bacterium]|nr:hypothetical protein [Candidatus Eremiobacteraeota bacterium]